MGGGCAVEWKRACLGVRSVHRCRARPRPGGPRGTGPGPVSTPSNNRSGSTGGRVPEGTLRSPGGSGGPRGRRNQCIHSCQLDQSETSAPSRNRLSPGGGRQPPPSGGRDSDQQTEAVGQAPWTAYPLPRPKRELEGARPRRTSRLHEPRCDSLADDPNGPSPRRLLTLPGWPAVGFIPWLLVGPPRHKPSCVMSLFCPPLGKDSQRPKCFFFPFT